MHNERILWSIDEVATSEDRIALDRQLRAGSHPFAYYAKHDHGTEAPEFFWGADLMVEGTSRYGGLAHASGRDVPDSLEALPADGVARGVWERIQTIFESADFNVHGVFLNGQSYGQDGEIHRDWERPGEGYTFVVFMNTSWEAPWQGEAVFYDEHHTAIRWSVIPEPGRLVVFDGSIPHWGRAPARRYPGLRLTLAFHTTLADGSIFPDASALRLGRSMLLQKSGTAPRGT
jgi:SM-20-related protein